MPEPTQTALQWRWQRSAHQVHPLHTLLGAGLLVHPPQPPVSPTSTIHPITLFHQRASTFMPRLAGTTSFLSCSHVHHNIQAGRDPRVGGAPGVLAPPKLYNEAQGKEAVAAAKVGV